MIPLQTPYLAKRIELAKYPFSVSRYPDIYIETGNELTVNRLGIPTVTNYISKKIPGLDFVEERISVNQTLLRQEDRCDQSVSTSTYLPRPVKWDMDEELSALYHDKHGFSALRQLLTTLANSRGVMSRLVHNADRSQLSMLNLMFSNVGTRRYTNWFFSALNMLHESVWLETEQYHAADLVTRNQDGDVEPLIHLISATEDFNDPNFGELQIFNAGRALIQGNHWLLSAEDAVDFEFLGLIVGIAYGVDYYYRYQANHDGDNWNRLVRGQWESARPNHFYVHVGATDITAADETILREAANRAVRDYVPSGQILAAINYMLDHTGAVDDYLDAWTLHSGLVYDSSVAAWTGSNLAGKARRVNGWFNASELNLPRDITAWEYFQPYISPTDDLSDGYALTSCLATSKIWSISSYLHAQIQVCVETTLAGLSLTADVLRNANNVRGSVANLRDAMLRQRTAKVPSLFWQGVINTFGVLYGFAPSHYLMNVFRFDTLYAIGLNQNGPYVSIAHQFEDFKIPYCRTPLEHSLLLRCIPDYHMIPHVDGGVKWPEKTPAPIISLGHPLQNVRLAKTMDPDVTRLWLGDGGFTYSAQYYAAGCRNTANNNPMRIDGRVWEHPMQYNLPANPTAFELQRMPAPFNHCIVPGQMGNFNPRTLNTKAYAVHSYQGPRNNWTRIALHDISSIVTYRINDLFLRDVESIGGQDYFFSAIRKETEITAFNFLDVAHKSKNDVFTGAETGAAVAANDNYLENPNGSHFLQRKRTNEFMNRAGDVFEIGQSPQERFDPEALNRSRRENINRENQRRYQRKIDAGFISKKRANRTSRADFDEYLSSEAPKQMIHPDSIDMVRKPNRRPATTVGKKRIRTRSKNSDAVEREKMNNIRGFIFDEQELADSVSFVQNELSTKRNEAFDIVLENAAQRKAQISSAYKHGDIGFDEALQQVREIDLLSISKEIIERRKDEIDEPIDNYLDEGEAKRNASDANAYRIDESRPLDFSYESEEELNDSAYESLSGLIFEKNETKPKGVDGSLKGGRGKTQNYNPVPLN
jgi:hypothetical protein